MHAHALPGGIYGRDSPCPLIFARAPANRPTCPAHTSSGRWFPIDERRATHAAGLVQRTSKLGELGPTLNGLTLLTLLVLLLSSPHLNLYIDPLSLDGPWLTGLSECDRYRTGQDEAVPIDDGADSWSK
ncbi:hypothetical protein MVEG_09651 [Podila verticillata NRRL 6337]|nr:hypothetical protein MVEG_09651 [Podila verticillata NRRL 6337]